MKNALIFEEFYSDCKHSIDPSQVLKSFNSYDSFMLFCSRTINFAEKPQLKTIICKIININILNHIVHT